MNRGRRRSIPLPIRRSVGRVVRRLPAPRDEAMLAALQSALDFARGRQPYIGHVGEQLHVEAGWRLVNAYEQLGIRDARQVFRAEIESSVEYARCSVSNLAPWDSGTGSLDVYEIDSNRVRFRRTMDFVLPGDRVFDVGFGKGYLGGLLLRDADVEAYHGIDVVPEYVEIFERMRNANDLAGENVSIKLGNLYELRRSDIEEAGATLVICCEVLEHVPDAEKALTTLAAALPKGTDLLFSVPLHGRLESVWGHLSVFDVSRLKAMLAAAGLVPHYVEPVANTWTFVVASRSSAPSYRIRNSKPSPSIVPDTLDPLYEFVDVDPDDFELVVDEAIIQGSMGSSDRVVELEVAHNSPDEGSGQIGVEFPVSGLRAIRLEIGFRDFEGVEKVMVRGFSGREQTVGWLWNVNRSHWTSRKSRRFALRPGQSAPPFYCLERRPPAQWREAGSKVDMLQILLQVSAGSPRLTIRVGYLPAKDPSPDQQGVTREF